VIVIGILGIAFYLSYQFYLLHSVTINTRNDPLITPSQNSQSTIFPSINISTTAVSPSSQSEQFQDLLNETVKPITQIDLSSWKVFEDKQVGIRFKYPPDWGEPQSELRNLNNPSTEYPPESGWVFYVMFSNNNNINITGGSNDFMRAIGGCTFIGFGTEKYPSAQQYCELTKDYVIYCQPIKENLHILSGFNSGIGSECHHSLPYNRIYFLNRPNKLISGIEFGGQFLSPRYYGSNGSSKYSLEEFLKAANNDKSIVNKLVLDRKLDAESIKNYDAIEKLFETIEEF
jgi:hypothetical protein